MTFMIPMKMKKMNRLRRFSYEVGHTLEYSCKYEKNIKKKVELLLKYGEMKEEQIADLPIKMNRHRNFLIKMKKQKKNKHWN